MKELSCKVRQKVCSGSRQGVLDPLELVNFSLGTTIQQRIVVIKPTRNFWCSNGFCHVVSECWMYVQKSSYMEVARFYQRFDVVGERKSIIQHNANSFDGIRSLDRCFSNSDTSNGFSEAGMLWGTEDLSGLSARPLMQNQAWRSGRQFSKVETDWLFWTDTTSWVSCAYCRWLMPQDVTMWLIGEV
jgi:hypothetical protein